MPEEYDFAFSGAAQRRLYEDFRDELRRLPWEAIQGTVRETGGYRLELAHELQTASLAAGLPDTLSEQEVKDARHFALVQVVCREKRFGLTRRPDPQSGEMGYRVTTRAEIPPGAAPRRLRRPTARPRREGSAIDHHASDRDIPG